MVKVIRVNGFCDRIIEGKKGDSRNEYGCAPRARLREVLVPRDAGMNGAMGNGETANMTVVNQLMKAVKALSPSPVRCLHAASLVAMPTGNISYHSSQPINLPTMMRNSVPGAYR